MIHSMNSLYLQKKVNGKKCLSSSLNIILMTQGWKLPLGWICILKLILWIIYCICKIISKGMKISSLADIWNETIRGVMKWQRKSWIAFHTINLILIMQHTHTQMVTDSNGDDDDNDDDWKHRFQLSGWLMEYHWSFLLVKSRLYFFSSSFIYENLI